MYRTVQEDSLSKKKTKLFKINFSAAGMVSLMIFAASLLMIATALIIAFRSYGHGDNVIGGLGFLAFFLQIFGLILPIQDKKKRPKEEEMPLLSKISIGCNAVGMAGLTAVYVLGIVL